MAEILYHAATHPKHVLEAAHSLITGKEKSVTNVRKLGGKQVTFTGIMPEMISTLLHMGGTYEPDVATFLNDAVKPGNVFYDIGAHFGYHSQQAASLVGENGSVVSFEPSPKTAELLTQNLESFPHARVEQIAIGDGSRDTMSFTQLGTRFSAWNTGYEHRIAKPFARLAKPEKIIVPMRSVDQYVSAGNPPPNVIKVDVENGELQTLHGARETIRKYKPSIMIECGDRGRTAATSTKMTLEFLAAHGYKLYEFDNQTKSIHPHVIRSTPYRYMNVLAKA